VTRQLLVTIERAAGKTWNFLVIDNGCAILNDADGPSHESDVIGLPLARFARQLGRRSNETINSTGMMAGWFFD
jgi:hypothetical protein